MIVCVVWRRLWSQGEKLLLSCRGAFVDLHRPLPDEMRYRRRAGHFLSLLPGFTCKNAKRKGKETLTE